MPDLGVIPVFYSARPTVELEGVDEPALAEGLLSLLVEETADGLYRCEATFGNWGTVGDTVGYLYADRSVLDFGKPIVFRGGAGDAEAELFRGRLTGLEAQFPRNSPPQLVVLAEDRLQDLRMTRRVRSFEEVTDEDVARQIAEDQGLQPEVDVDGPTYPVLTQLNQSDLAFLRERARRIDAEVWVEGDTLHLQSRDRREADELRLTYGQGLHEFSVLADLACQRTKVSVTGWDPATKETIQHEADEGSVSSELQGLDGGGGLLERAFGPRAEQLVHCTPQSEPEAQAIAEAEFRRLARRLLTGRGLCEGDGRIRVGARLDLAGLGPMFDGLYYVCRVQHAFDGRDGFRTRFEVERPGLGG